MKKWSVCRPYVHLGLALLMIGPAGCSGTSQDRTPVKAGFSPARLIDPVAQCDANTLLNWDDLTVIADKIKEDHKPKVLPPQKNVLVISGGGAFGAYPAGLLVGWTEAGTRPNFDVVTGISTGALIAVFAFAGPEYDPLLRQYYTSVTNKDVYKMKSILRGLLSESLADSTPMRDKIAETTTPEVIAKVAAEHRKGRRLYIGTTDLDARRPVIWDMGAIACDDTEGARDLFRMVMLASASIPGFFPPVRIPVTINGEKFVERHVDGGVTSALFVRPPWLPPEQRRDPTKSGLYGSNMYVMVAGKLYADQEEVRSRSLAVLGSSVSTLLYTQARDELFKLYFASALTGMNFKLSSVPEDVECKIDSTEFNPEAMSRLFEEGRSRAKSKDLWRTTPPGSLPREVPAFRGSIRLDYLPPNDDSMFLPPVPKPKSDLPTPANIRETFTGDPLMK
ncbi:patatin-like phospholipase family protein [Zavarzinella formosa]|uniref:patatin-like phospholipase family protein n=1 Tax=Zavarzinella formosa TaxID=360055 RepID=UPI00031DAD60|nr:patatin-like phospholipase family protein [Zavarzinella formosa]